MDERSVRVAVILIAHVVFLSGFALRLRRGDRRHLLHARAPWWLRYAPPLAWIPWVVALVVPALEIATSDVARALGLAIALGGSLFAAWSMWTLGRQYAIGLDLFEGHRLVARGPYRIVRHPLYLGILVYHVGAAVALGDLLLLALTALVVLPLLAYRSVVEERVLLEGLGEEYAAYRRRVPALLPGATARSG